MPLRATISSTVDTSVGWVVPSASSAGTRVLSSELARTCSAIVAGVLPSAIFCRCTFRRPPNFADSVA